MADACQVLATVAEMCALAAVGYIAHDDLSMRPG
jgi:hypothetical protein